MGDSLLNPTLVRRLSAALRPDWTRTVAARRLAAGGLVVLAGVATLRSNPEADYADVVVAAHDLSPATPLTADDVRLEKRTPATIPDGSRADVSSVVGSTLAGPARRGEVLTDVRVLGSRLAESTAGPGARIVPLHLADNALIDLVRVGDVVDVLAAPTTGTPDNAPPASTVLATDAEGRIVRIGKMIEPYDAFDTGVFLATPQLIQAIQDDVAAGGNGGLSGGVQRLADQGLAGTLDIGSRFWLDVDDAVAFGHAEREQARLAG